MKTLAAKTLKVKHWTCPLSHPTLIGSSSGTPKAISARDANSPVPHCRRSEQASTTSALLTALPQGRKTHWPPQCIQNPASRSQLDLVPIPALPVMLCVASITLQPQFDHLQNGINHHHHHHYNNKLLTLVPGMCSTLNKCINT